MTDTITTELRESMVVDARGLLYIGETALADLCDAIDAVHASLEAELAEWGERGVLLPLDADGVPVRLDDLMEWPDHTDNPFEVIGIGNGTLYYVEGGVIQWTRAETKRHYTPDTWERIIEDARAYSMNISGSYLWKNKTDELVARCKALAGDAE